MCTEQQTIYNKWQYENMRNAIQNENNFANKYTNTSMYVDTYWVCWDQRWLYSLSKEGSVQVKVLSNSLYLVQSALVVS